MTLAIQMFLVCLPIAIAFWLTAFGLAWFFDKGAKETMTLKELWLGLLLATGISLGIGIVFGFAGWWYTDVVSIAGG